MAYNFLVFEQRECSENYSYIVLELDESGAKAENAIVKGIYYNEFIEKVVV